MLVKKQWGKMRLSPLSVCVLDVEPDDVVGNLVLIKARVHRVHVGLILVVPSALVVANGEQLQGGIGTRVCQKFVFLRSWSSLIVLLNGN